MEYNQPPNHPSLTPPARVVMPCALSTSQALSRSSHVFGTVRPLALNTSVRASTGNCGLTYQGAVSVLSPLLSSNCAFVECLSSSAGMRSDTGVIDRDQYGCCEWMPP